MGVSKSREAAETRRESCFRGHASSMGLATAYDSDDKFRLSETGSRLGLDGLLTWEFWTSLREMKDITIPFHRVRKLVEVAHLRQMPRPQLSHGIDICKYQYKYDSLRPYVSLAIFHSYRAKQASTECSSY